MRHLPRSAAAVGMTIYLEVDDFYRKFAFLQQNCHPDRSVAKWRDLRLTRAASNTNGSAILPFVISRACDFFDLFAFFAPDQMFFCPLQKGVILSEAPRRSIA